MLKNKKNISLQLSYQVYRLYKVFRYHKMRAIGLWFFRTLIKCLFNGLYKFIVYYHILNILITINLSAIIVINDLIFIHILKYFKLKIMF